MPFFGQQVVLVSIPSGGIILFPLNSLTIDRETLASFHPVWRDYPISTRISLPELLLRGGKCLSFHPVWRDYPISTPDRRSANRADQRRRFHPVWRDYPISTNRMKRKKGIRNE